MNYRIFPPQELLEARVQLPLSKSMSNRALIINALTPAAPSLADVAVCTDTEALRHALASDADAINVGGAGTAMRFLTAYFAACCGRCVVLDGDDRMRQRPIGPLVDALRVCGADITYVGEEGFPPLKISGRRMRGGEVSIDASVSSQYVSAMLMVAPVMECGLTLTLVGEVASAPYIDLTIDMMSRAGACVERNAGVITVAHGTYSHALPPIEADWSAASYWYELEAITSGFITLDGLNAHSCQGDRQVAEIFAGLGVTTDFEPETGGTDLLGSPDVAPRLTLDLSACPDLAQTIAVTCAMIGVPFNLTGLASLKIKETDRIAALSQELAKVGVMTDVTGSSISWDGRRQPIVTMPEFDTYGDHRMAMSLAPVAVYIPGIVVRNPEVVAKSYPQYWEHLQQAGFSMVDADIPLEQILNDESQN